MSAAGGIITLPADIQPSANNFPVAIVYDADGSVTNALLGQGAGSAGSCFTNAAYGGVDSFSTDAHLLHALVILNGICAQTSTQLPDMKYRLVRVLGRVLGLDWSQMNLNVFTHSPAPTSSDYAGLTIMHATDPINCVPISICYPNADQPKMDDRAALSRLYPVTAQNQAAFPGKQLFFENTVRIHGSVYFADSNGQAAQPMQGVNVVARWIDPATSQPSRTYGAASVSGFLFRGNAGNAATGFYDSTGQAWDRFGSDDAAVEGFFDLGGLEIPNGASSAQYQLSVEALDPSWSQSVGPYGPWQVQPSGTFQPLIVTVSKGGDLQQDILMQASAVQARDWFEPTSFAAPATLPPSGDWLGTLSGLGNADYFWFVAQSDRTLSVEVTALDELKAASLVKAQPVIGMWALADPGTFPAPANTGLAFNSANFGMTRLDATLQASTAFRLGIFDYRSDGRPDYRYHARVFYADNAVPARARVDGGTAITVQGIGFRTNTAATIASVTAPVLAASASQVIATAPAMADGLQNIGLRDPATGASSTMTNALTYGAGPSDTIKLIQGSNPATPVGGQAPNPIRVQVLAPDGTTPVAGASVFFISTPASSLSACGGAASCTILTDDSGHASTRVTVLQAAVINISALLAPASYNTPKSVQATILGTTSALDISLLSSFAWIAQGATVDIALAARLLSNGLPVAATQVNYQVVKGSGTLSFCQQHQRRQRLCRHHAAPGGHGGRCAGERMCRPGQPAVPDLFRDCGAAFDAPAGTGGRKRSVPSRRPAFSTGHRASRRFRDRSTPGAGRERNFPGGGVASGDCAPAGFDRRNYHWQESSAGHRVFIPDVGAVGRPGTVHASALNRRSSRSAGDSRHSRGRGQCSFLPATVSFAGSALGAVRLVTSSAGWSSRNDRNRPAAFPGNLRMLQPQ